MVRLAFAVMVEADADIMLIDEVLAVGDAAFGQKCMDVFRARRNAGKTVVLVTHDMATVQSFCDRAMLLHDGERPVPRRPRGGGAPLLPAELQRPRRGRRAPERARRQRPPDRRLARERGGRARREHRAGRADRLQRDLRGSPRPRPPGVRIPLPHRRRRPAVRLQPVARVRPDGEPDVLHAGRRVRLSGHDRKPPAARPLLRQRDDQPQPHRRRPRPPRPPAARLRRVRDRARARRACASMSTSTSALEDAA